MIQLTDWEAALLMAGLGQSGIVLWDLRKQSRQLRAVLDRLAEAGLDHDEPDLYSPDCIRGFSCQVCGAFWRAEVRRDPQHVSGWRIRHRDPAPGHGFAGSHDAWAVAGVLCKAQTEAQRTQTPYGSGLRYARPHFIHVAAED